MTRNSTFKKTVKYHNWSQQDLDLLRENVGKYGPTSGCERTAKEIGVKAATVSVMYYSKLYNENESSYHKWTSEETDLLKEMALRHGSAKSVDIVSKLIGVNKRKVATKLNRLVNDGFECNRRRRVSKDEEKKIAEFLHRKISENPNNLAQACRETAEEFNLSVSAIQHRWYGSISKNGKYLQDYSDRPSCRNNAGVVYSVIGDNATVNGKNQEKPQLGKTKWILSFIREIIRNIKGNEKTGKNSKKTA